MAKIYAVSSERHRDFSWVISDSKSWARQEQICPLGYKESTKVMLTLPLAFVKNGENYEIVALVGIGSKRNLQLDANGRWLGEYMPHYYRYYPFVMGKKENGDFALCVDEESEGIIKGEGGNPFFDEEGNPCANVIDIMNGLGEWEQDKMIANAGCEVLNKHGIITPWKFTIIIGDKEEEVQGLYKVDEEAYGKLSPEALAELRDRGGMTLFFCQAIAMQHLASGKMPVGKQRGNDDSKALESISTSSGNISLDFL